MPARCNKCDLEIPVDRITGFLLPANLPLEEWTCKDCAPTREFFGVMAPSAEFTDGKNDNKVYGKNSSVLNLIPLDKSSHSKEMLRQAKRFLKRAR